MGNLHRGGGGGGGGGGNLTGIIINGEAEGANQTSDTATNLGPLNIGAPINFINEDITRFPDGRNEYEWYRFTAGQAGTFTATETTLTGGSLELHLFTLQGNTLVNLVNTIHRNKCANRYVCGRGRSANPCRGQGIEQQLRRSSIRERIS